MGKKDVSYKNWNWKDGVGEMVKLPGHHVHPGGTIGKSPQKSTVNSKYILCKRHLSH